MSTRKFPQLCLLLVLGLSAAPGALAQGLAMVSSADQCNIRNPGSRAVEDLRREHGEIRNLSEDRRITISCPITTLFGFPNYAIVMSVWNYDAVPQSFKCVVQEFDPMAFLVSTWRESEDVDGGGGALLVYSDIQLSSPLNRLHMWCGLPPKGAYGLLVQDNY